ncbi:MAG: substrate binding domain-containing protein, partial [Tateyamaria sp.]
RKLADDTRVLCAAPSYVETHGMPKTPAELQNHQFIAWSDLEPRPLIGPGGEAATLNPSDMICRAILDDGDAQREATIAGAGISINSLWSVSEELASGRLVRLLPGWRMNDHSVLWLVYPRSNVLTPKTRFFIDFLIANLGNRPDWRDQAGSAAPA